MKSIRSFFFLLAGAASSFRCGPSRPCPFGTDFAAALLDGVGYEVEEDAGAGDDEDPELDGLGTAAFGGSVLVGGAALLDFAASLPSWVAWLSPRSSIVNRL